MTPSPQGTLLDRIPFPVPGPTMPCFADGALWVTSLREGKPPEVLERFPALGGLFRAATTVAGAAVGGLHQPRPAAGPESDERRHRQSR